MKICSKCKLDKELSEYWTARGACIPCEKARIKNSRDTNRTRRLKRTREYNVRNYGMLWGDFLAMLKSQGNSCAICGKTSAGIEGKRMYIDHCHRTGYVRGILCQSCNSGLGYFNDNKVNLYSAVDYLERFASEGYRSKFNKNRPIRKTTQRHKS